MAGRGDGVVEAIRTTDGGRRGEAGEEGFAQLTVATRGEGGVDEGELQN